MLYVVDGTRPFRRNYEAEMEILRWTGRPGMALVNRIGDEDYGLEWHRALDQYFKMVRDFDAFSVSFEERLKLLESFRELRPESRAAIDEAITALTAQRRRRRADAGSEIADLLLDELTHTEEIAVAHEAALEAERDRLERSFHDHLREREEKARRRVEALYAHGEVRFETTSLDRPIFQQDLFAEETWRLLGLAPVELVAASTLAGAAVGGAVDALVGGASLLAGTAIGGAVGGATALFGLGRRYASVRQIGPGGIAGWWSAARPTLSHRSPCAAELSLGAARSGALALRQRGPQDARPARHHSDFRRHRTRRRGRGARARGPAQSRGSVSQDPPLRRRSAPRAARLAGVVRRPGAAADRPASG